MTDYQRGLLLTGLGVLFLTPDALLVRLIECPPWTLLFWRGVLMSFGFSLFLVATRRHPSNLSGKGWLAALFLAGSTTCFVFSLQETHAANTLVIIATSPLIAALLSKYLLHEDIPRATWLAIITATAGVSLSLLDGSGRGSLRGELLATGSAICMASHFTALRWWKSKDGPLAVWGAGWLAGLIALPFADVGAVPSEDWKWVFLLGLGVLPLAFGLMATGPRYLPAPEVGLLLLGETVLGPLWVWLALSERPGWATLTGGAVVVLTLTLHSLSRRQV